MGRLYYSIGEVAEILGENVSLVRFWSDYFTRFIKPERNGKGNRLYTASDIETLKQVHFLVKSVGMTLSGAATRLASEKKSIAARVRALDCLKEIRQQLKEIRDAL